MRVLIWAKANLLDPNLPDCPAYETGFSLTCRTSRSADEFNRAVVWDAYLGLRNGPSLRGAWLNTNSLGYRGSEISAQKGPSTYRAAIIGGSAAMGYGVRDDETIAAYLQPLLQAKLPSHSVEVVNAGMAGFNSSQELVEFALEIVDLRPDLVIVFDGANDLLFGLASDWVPHRTPAMRQGAAQMTERLNGSLVAAGKEVVRALVHNSEILSVAGRYLASLRSSASFGERVFQPAAIDVYVANHRRMAALAKSSGIKMVFVVQPALGVGNKAATEAELDQLKRSPDFLVKSLSFFPELRKAHDRACISGEALCLDYSDIFASELRTVFIDPVHLNPTGNGIVAAHLARDVQW